MDQQSQFYEIDLMQLLYALWHRVWIIIIAAILCGGIAFSYVTFMVRPKYQAEAMIYVNNSSFSLGNTTYSISSGELAAAQSLVDTYIVILKTRNTLNEVIEKAGLNYSYQQLYGMISAKPINNTEVFSITVTDYDPKEAERIANIIADILPDKIADIVDGSSMRVVDYAVVPSVKSSPSISKYTMIGAFMGILLACAAIILKEITDTQIHGEDYLIKNYDIPVLAIIPNLSSSKNTSYYYSYEYNDKSQKR